MTDLDYKLVSNFQLKKSVLKVQPIQAEKPEKKSEILEFLKNLKTNPFSAPTLPTTTNIKQKLQKANSRI